MSTRLMFGPFIGLATAVPFLDCVFLDVGDEDEEEEYRWICPPDHDFDIRTHSPPA